MADYVEKTGSRVSQILKNVRLRSELQINGHITCERNHKQRCGTEIRRY
jgi:hypothetical protein